MLQLFNAQGLNLVLPEAAGKWWKENKLHHKFVAAASREICVNLYLLEQALPL